MNISELKAQVDQIYESHDKSNCTVFSSDVPWVQIETKIKNPHITVFVRKASYHNLPANYHCRVKKYGFIKIDTENNLLEAAISSAVTKYLSNWTAALLEDGHMFLHLNQLDMEPTFDDKDNPRLLRAAIKKANTFLKSNGVPPRYIKKNMWCSCPNSKSLRNISSELLMSPKYQPIIGLELTVKSKSNGK